MSSHAAALEVIPLIYGVFGLPRSGKTTYLCKIAKSYIKRGVRVYTNFPCHGCYKLDFSKLGRFDFSNCVLLIDEISLVADSRDWKNFNSDLVYFFTNHGHYKVDIYYCSQWFTDTDIKIRRMTEELYYIQSAFFGLSLRYTVMRDICTTDRGEITDTYKFKHPRLFFRPLYYSMFDSFSRKKLPTFTAEMWKKV